MLFLHGYWLCCFCTVIDIVRETAIVLFFQRKRSRGQSRISHQKHSPTQARMVKIALNLVRMRHLAIHTLAAPQSEKRTCKSACSSARQDRTPPEPPRLLHSALHHSGLRPHLGLGEQLDKRAGLLGPSSAHLQGQHHQTSPSTLLPQAPGRSLPSPGALARATPSLLAAPLRGTPVALDC